MRCKPCVWPIEKDNIRGRMSLSDSPSIIIPSVFGAKIYTPTPGTIDLSGFGVLPRLVSGDGLTHYFRGLDLALDDGDQVDTGELLGVVGMGDALEWWVEGESGFLNPVSWGKELGASFVGQAGEQAQQGQSRVIINNGAEQGKAEKEDIQVGFWGMALILGIVAYSASRK